MRFLILCLILFSSEMSYGQQLTDSLSLGRDKAFSTYIQRTVRFPFDAVRQGTMGKVYAGFKLDEQGAIQDIAILNPQRPNYSFVKEITSVLKKLPKQLPIYKGDYILPFYFGYSNEMNNPQLKSIQESNPPDELVGQRKLLPQINVMASQAHKF